VVKSYSAKHCPVSSHSPFNKLKGKTKEKGIKLTHHSSSQALRQTPIKLKTIQTLDTSRHYELNIKKIKSAEVDQEPQLSTSRRMFVTTKCLDYKNKKILEHGSQQLDQSYEQLQLTPKRTNVSNSTLQETPRDPKDEAEKQRCLQLARAKANRVERS
jgi:hypothetical protein